ncbi:MAG TPA: glycosyltransferase [Anaerolineae bacterium]|nr:glycosyltransferase [Anaerolineae bacterium]
MSQPIDVSIVVPAYNESENIVDTVNRLTATFTPRPENWQVIFVNDGSTDDTWAVAQRLAQENPRVIAAGYAHNVGRGRALRHGFNRATGRFIVATDADLSYDPKYILDLLDTLYQDPETDFVLGSPYMPGGDTEGVDPKRLFISKLGNVVLRYFVNKDIYTWTGVFRAYRREVLDAIDLEADDKTLHLEIISRALAAGYKVKEVPAVLASRKKGSSKFRFRGTAVSHLIFSFYERPIWIFGSLGFSMLCLGTFIGFYLTYLYTQSTLNANRPLFTLMLLLIIGGVQILSFGFIALQIGILRREIIKVQRETRLLTRHLDNSNK